jgi:hypothetical protein
LSNLEKQYDQVIQNQRQAAEKKKKVDTSEFTAAASIPVDLNTEREMNYLYERFLENQLSLRDIDVYKYDDFKKRGLLNFSDDLLMKIENESNNYLIENNLQTTDEFKQKYFRRFCVVEYFRQKQSQEALTA